MRKVTDADGKLIEVIIPAEEWDLIISKHADLEHNSIIWPTRDIKDSVGWLEPGKAREWLDNVAQTKNEWD